MAYYGLVIKKKGMDVICKLHVHTLYYLFEGFRASYIHALLHVHTLYYMYTHTLLPASELAIYMLYYMYTHSTTYTHTLLPASELAIYM